MILAVFSSCLKTRLMQQIKIHDHQFCFKSGGITHALARVESFKAQGKTLTLADCTNAYQAIDQNALIHSLQLNGVNSLFVEYYRTYLDTRSCKYADNITSGCPAGNSTSALAFAGTLTDVIAAMEAKGYQLTVFADDIQISHDQNVDKDVVLQELAALLQPLGLELALNKCSSTQDGGEITFLGQTFSQSSTVSLAERMTAKIDKCLKVLDASPITNHKKYQKMTAQHEIRCNRNAGIRTVRHDNMVNRILTKIDHHRHPRPVDKAHGNLPSSDKLEKPDIEFQYKNATYVLDVTFAVEANICNAFKGKILKYGGTYGDNRVIPLVLRYNGTVYEKSMNMLTTFLPEITDSFLSKHCCLAVARANEEAKLHYTSLITNALHEGTIATKQGQRDRQATGRRAPRAPPGLEGVGARQEGEAQGNAGSDGLGVTVDN
ncbi:Reverse_transcriptase/endonuclease [Hexamita inflata]|uniref:Putative n=1 Tax=Hexamita inflata TaxID=28002 RepID=A0AA86TMY9_9EUKA|nr:Reverse transcriptase/endonuclease [Hexamita inflata]